MIRTTKCRIRPRGQQAGPVLTLLAVVALALGPAHALAQINRLYDSDTGTWSTPGDWLPGAADVPNYPINGDWIIYDSEMDLVTGNQAFGNAANGSTWTSGGMDLNGNTLTHDPLSAGSTWTMTGGNKDVRANNNLASEIINNGTFLHATSNQLRMRSGLTITNNGQFTMSVNGGDVRGEGDSDAFPQTFVNSATGTVSATNGAGSVQFQSNSAGARGLTLDNRGIIESTGGADLVIQSRFVDTTGGTVRTTGASDVLFTSGSTAGNSSVATSAWNTAGTGTIELGGTWGGDLLGTVGGATGNVVIGETLTAAGNFSIDLDTTLASGGTNATPVSGTLGWENGNIQPNGFSITLDTDVSYNSTGNLSILNPGNNVNSKIINAAGQTFTHDSATQIRIYSSTTFQNDGQFNFTTAGGRVRHEGGNASTFVNSATGTVSSTNVSGSVEFQQNGGNDRLTVQNNIGATIQAAGSGGTLRMGGRLDELGGTMEALAGATLEITGGNNSSVSGTAWNTTGTGKIELGGAWGGTGGDLRGTVGGATGNVVIGETLTAAGNFSIDLDTTLASGGTNATPVSGTLGWENGNIQPNGFSITLDTDVSFNSTGTKSILNPGNNVNSKIINAAGQTFTHDSTAQIHIYSSTTFQNDGQFNFTTSGGDFRHQGGNASTFVNSATGTVSSTNVSGSVEFQQNGGNDRLTVQNNIGATIQAAGSGGTLRMGGRLDELGGTMEALAGATLEITGGNNSSVSGTAWNTTGTGKIELGGAWGGTGGDLLGTVGGSGNVVIGETVTAAGDFSIDLDVSGASGGTNATPVAMTLGWEAGSINTNGNTITLDTDVSFNSTGNRAIGESGPASAAGTLLNPSTQTFTHDSSAQILLRSGVEFRNEGTFEFTTSGGDVRHDQNVQPTTFTNVAGALVTSSNTTGSVEFQQTGTDRLTIQNNIGATIQAAGVGGRLRVGGKLDELGGTMEALAGSTLEITGGNNSSVSGTAWNTTGTGKIELGGAWGGTGSDLLGTVGGSGNVVIGETLTAAGNFSIDLDVSGASGGTNATPVAMTLGWEAGSINTNGNTITLDTDVSFNSTGNRVIGESGPASAAGTLLNPSGQTFTHDSNQQILFRSGVEFRNEGTFQFTTNGGDIRHDQNNAQITSFTNVAGALVTSSNTTGSVEFQQNGTDRLTVQNNIGATIQAAGVGGRLRVGTKLDELGGTMEALAGSTLEITGANNSSVSGTAWNTTGSGKVELGGFWGGTGSDLLGTVGGATGNVVIGETLTAAGDFSINLNVSGASGGTNATPVAMTLGWENGAIRTNGNTITLDTDVSFNSTGNQTIGETGPASAAGTLLNPSGQTFTHDSSAQIILRSGVEIRNEGTFEFTTNGGDIRHDQNNAQSTTFTNVAGGVVRATDTGGTVAFQSRHTNGLRVDNQGTIEVVANTSATTLNMDTNTRFLQYDTGTDTLTGGTYRIISDGPAATLDIDARDATGTVGVNDGIGTIGAAASVVLSGANATFNQLNGTASDLATVDGLLGLHDGQMFTTTGNFSVPGVLEFGLGASDEGLGAGFLTGLSITGDPTFGGTVDVVDLGDMIAGTYRIIDWAGTRSSLLSLGNSPSNGFAYDLVLNDASNFYVLNVSELASGVPEPSTLMLLGLGTFFLLTMRRRKRVREE